jgi:hypothetical protein
MKRALILVAAGLALTILPARAEDKPERGDRIERAVPNNEAQGDRDRAAPAERYERSKGDFGGSGVERHDDFGRGDDGRPIVPRDRDPVRGQADPDRADPDRR